MPKHAQSVITSNLQEVVPAIQSFQSSLTHVAKAHTRNTSMSIKINVF